MLKRLLRLALLVTVLLAVMVPSAWAACGYETGSPCPAQGWTSLGGAIVGGPDSPNWTESQVLVRGTDNAFWIRHFRDDTSTWDPTFASIGGSFTSDPGSLLKGPRLEVFGRGSDGAVWTRRRLEQSWSPHWETLGGNILHSPDAIESDEFASEVYAIGTDGALWWNASDGTQWRGWQSLGGQATSSPAAIQRVQNDANHVHVYMRGTDGALWERVRIGDSWSPNWVSRGGALTSGPDAGNEFLGFVQVFARGGDNAVWSVHTADGTNYSGWSSIGGVITSDPGAESHGAEYGSSHPSRTFVYGRGTDGALWYNTLRSTEVNGA